MISPKRRARRRISECALCLIAALTAACSTAPPARENASQDGYLKSWSAIYRSEDESVSEESYRRSLELLKAPAFRTLSGSMQHLLLMRTAGVALHLKDYVRAHELAVRASSMADAGVADWLLRLDAAYDGHDRIDACRSLTYVFRQWPDKRSRVPAHLVRSLTDPAPTSAGEKEARFELLETLYDAGWTGQYGVKPSYPWGELVQELAERGDLHRALEVAADVNSPRVMVKLRADKRGVLDVPLPNPDA